jgi:pyrroline-5-carboxylate reductase
MSNVERRIAFIGGGNMAGALIGGLIRRGHMAQRLHAVEVDAARRTQLQREFGITAAVAPDGALRGADIVVLAVKPQQMRDACAQIKPHLSSPLVLSIAAGIRAADIARWLGTQRVVRSMPNTPALIGMGIAGAAALAQVNTDERAAAAAVLEAVGKVVWFDDEAQLDAVTAISGSGPAYVFFFIEALIAAGRAMGFSEMQARELAIQTFVGASQLAAQSSDPVATLRERVTSKGGTTAAALASLQTDGVHDAIVRALHAAHRRAIELGDEFGRD